MKGNPLLQNVCYAPNSAVIIQNLDKLGLKCIYYCKITTRYVSSTIRHSFLQFTVSLYIFNSDVLLMVQPVCIKDLFMKPRGGDHLKTKCKPSPTEISHHFSTLNFLFLKLFSPLRTFSSPTSPPSTSSPPAVNVYRTQKHHAFMRLSLKLERLETGLPPPPGCGTHRPLFQ